jgi:hypothetical protein
LQRSVLLESDISMLIPCILFLCLNKDELPNSITTNAIRIIRKRESSNLKITWWRGWRLKAPQANNSWDPISKITRAKWTGGAAQVAEYLQAQSPKLKPQCHRKTKEKENKHFKSHKYILSFQWIITIFPLVSPLRLRNNLI